MNPDRITPQEVDLVLSRLSPQARFALETLAKSRSRPVEDVLREEMRVYLAGRLPVLPIDAAMQGLKATARSAGWLIGRLKRFAREQGADES